MSIDLNWETLTSGPDGDRYAAHIRDFIHTKFQTIPFPKFIKSVHVHTFTFGSVPPDIEIKEISSPYPEFYEEEDSSSDCSTTSSTSLLKLERERRRRDRRNDSPDIPSTPSTQQQQQPPPPYSLDGSTRIGAFRGGPFSPDFPGRVGVTGVSTPLFNRAGSSSNLHYFHSALSSGFSAASTPLPPFVPSRDDSTGSFPSPPSTADSDPQGLSEPDPAPVEEEDGESAPRRSIGGEPRLREPRDEDTQIVARVRYSGDVRLELTAELLLEYPITAFAALPVRLVVTGCRFDGLACVAYIGRRAHFCFLEAERGEGSLLKEIKVESEIGEKGKGKQVLKNVGKVERFVLEQVRRIFEEEFVFPSSWTFLV